MPHDLETLAIDPARAEALLSARQDARAAGPVPARAPYYRAGPGGDVAVVPVTGYLSRGLHMPPYATSYAAIERGIDAALAEGAAGVVLHLDSGGGEVAGLFGTMDRIRARRGAVPIVALIDEMAGSAAYGLASQADRIVMASPTAEAGSIGVVAMHVDQSGALAKQGLEVSLIYSGKRKIDGASVRPLSKEAREKLQADVDELRAGLAERVALGRGVPVATVLNTEAETYRGDAAVAAGLVDEIIESPAALLRDLASSSTKEARVPHDFRNPGDPAGTPDPATATHPAADAMSFAELRAMAGPILGEDLLAHADRLVAMSRDEAGQEILRIAAARSEANPISNRTVPRELRASVPNTAHNTATMDNPDAFAAAAGEALAARYNPAADLSPQAQQFAGAGTHEIARAVLDRHGIRSNAAGGQAVIRALGGAHTRSDFAHVLEEFSRRELARAFNAAPSGLMRVSRERSAVDFRAIKRVALGEYPELVETNEHGEFTRSTIGEAAESYAVKTFGRIISLTRHAIVNDDLDAFSDLAVRAGQAARDLEAKTLFELIDSNPVMATDGKAVFHADHGNLAASGTSIADGLSAARQAMRTQRGIDGQMLVQVAPRFLICGPDRETEGEKALAAIAATKIDDVNPFSNLTLVVEPRMSQKWYLFSDPMALALLEHAYLQGQRQPEVISDAGFDVDGVRMRVRHDFGAGVVEYRAGYLNPGD